MNENDNIATPENIELLKSMLNMRSSDDAKLAFAIIRIMVSIMNPEGDVPPSAQVAKRELDRIASTASKLANLIWTHPKAGNLLIESFCPRDPYQYEFETAKEHAAKMVPNLRSLAKFARQLLSEKKLFHDFYQMGPKGLPQTRILWPILFGLWERSGKRLSHTPNGPLHRFISFVHGLFELSPPSVSTLRDAIRMFKQSEFPKGRRAQFIATLSLKDYATASRATRYLQDIPDREDFGRLLRSKKRDSE